MTTMGMDFDALCPGCMQPKHPAAPDRCHWAADGGKLSVLQLAPGTVFDGRYLLGRVLGQGGFGITYLGWDRNLNRKLAVKEYFPRDLCTRLTDHRTVSPLSDRQAESFQRGLGKFREEGRALARFQEHPGVVSVLDFFEANGTAYLVMSYVDGMTFAQYLEQKGGKIPFETALNIVTHVMDALREVHAEGMLHRDVSPDNIYITAQGLVRILDFGTTRYSVGEHSQSLSLVLKSGYSPLEQYLERGRQGPWTDVYALAATLYRAITGKVPSAAPDRAAQDDLLPPSRLGGSLPPAAEAALMKALAIKAEQRFATVGEFQRAIGPAKAGTPLMPSEASAISPPSRPRLAWAPVAAGLLLLSTIGLGVQWKSMAGELDATKQSLSATTRELDTTKNDLTAMKSELERAKQQVAKLEGDVARVRFFAARPLESKLDGSPFRPSPGEFARTPETKPPVSPWNQSGLLGNEPVFPWNRPVAPGNQPADPRGQPQFNFNINVPGLPGGLPNPQPPRTRR